MNFYTLCHAVHKKRKAVKQTLRTMKLVALLITLTILQVSAKTYAQKVTLNEKDAQLETIFNKIKKQTGYIFFYKAGTLNGTGPISIQIKNADINTAMDQIIQGQPLLYTIAGQTIGIKRKEQPKTAEQTTTPGNVAPINITGKVTDTTNIALNGATVTNLSTKKTTRTAEDGTFTIQATAGDQITITYIGYKTYTFTAAENLPYQYILHDEQTSLKEVVVSNGYQLLPKERATGSFVQVNNKLINRRVSSSVLDRLEGIVPGLIFNTNASAGITQTGDAQQVNLSIHGRSTLFSNDQPLIVLDNFPYNGDIKNINPNNIESITVLKDAAASSIWGVKAGNGVIVITTKKGHQNQPLSIELNGAVTVGEKPDLLYDRNFLASDEFINIQKDFYARGYYTRAINSGTTALPPAVSILDEIFKDPSFAAAGNEQLIALSKNDVRKDINKYLYRNSVNQQYSANFRGGSVNSDYTATIGYDRNLNSLIGNESKRITINSMYDYFPVQNLKVTIGLNYTQGRSQANTPYLDGIVYPYTQLADNKGNPLPIVRDFNEEFKIKKEKEGYLNWQYSPLDELSSLDNTSGIIDNVMKFGAEYKFPYGFSTAINYQYENQLSTNRNLKNLQTYATRDLINRYTNLTANNKYPIPLGGIMDVNSSQLKSNQLRAQINYDNWFGKGQQLTSIIGAEVSDNVTELSGNRLYGYDDFTGLSNTSIDYVSYFPLTPNTSGTGQISQPYGGISGTTDHFVSYFGNAAYSLFEKYIFSASGRIDKSNLFGVNTNQKAKPLFSAGFAWAIDKEPFFKADWFQILKLRATYGYSGNISKQATGLTTITTYTNSFLSNENYAGITNPGNPELRWEKIRNINLGVDFLSKDQIIGGSLDFYWKKGLDLFGYSPLPSNTGLQTYFGNTANTSGHGFDLLLNSNLRIKDFKVNTTLIVSQAIDKVEQYLISNTALSTEYIRGSSAQNINPTVGKPLFAIYSFKSGGLTHETGDPQGYLNGALSTDYTSIIQNTKMEDLVFNGSARPTIYGSFRNDFSYKSLSLSVNFIYKFNYYFRRSTVAYGQLGQIGTMRIHEDYLQRWQKPGDELNTAIPSFQYPENAVIGRDDFFSLSNDFVEKGDHIRLQDISISYNLKEIWKKSPFKSLQIYGYANNLGIVWRANKKGLDPDLFGSSLPFPRTYSIGIKSNF